MPLLHILRSARPGELRFVGQVDRRNAGVLADAIEWESQRADGLTLDMHGLAVLDGAAIGALLDVAARTGQRLVIRGLSKPARMILQRLRMPSTRLAIVA